jgi:amidase
MVERREHVPKRDATVVSRMRAAGAIMLGKTLDGESNAVYGPGHNPYDLSRSPGASSSGEAAIIAAGGSPLGLGSDSGGSIRYPAHCCGVAGLKPTTGRVPLTGHFPRIGALSDPRTQIGPLARSVEDLALALPVIAGVDGRDPSVVPVPLGDSNDVTLAGQRIAYYTTYEGASPTPETAEAVRAAVAALTEAGAVAEEALPPRIEEAFEVTTAYWRRTRSAAWSEWTPGRESTMTADEIERSIFAWERLQRAFLGFMERYDVIVCPTAAGPAPAQDERETDFVYTVPYSLAGWPCVVVRAGTSPEGLPIGVQVVARPWREDVALAVARQIEGALGGWQAPPLP